MHSLQITILSKIFDKIKQEVHTLYMIEETLVTLGLTHEEVEIYITLLEYGILTPSEVSSKTKVKRTYVYKICEDLLSKGLVTVNKKENKKAYAPASPDFLLSIAERRRQEINNTQEQLEKILTDLKVKYNAVETKPIVKVYEGVEGLKKIYTDTLIDCKDIFALVNASKLDPELDEWLGSYVAKRKEKNIHAKVIVSSEKQAAGYISDSTGSLRTIKVVDATKYPIKNEIDIYGDKVAFIQNQKGEALVGMIVENKIIAETMKAWFDLAWGEDSSKKS